MSKKCLIVEDNRDSIAVLISHLKKLGYSLDFAGNGLEALGRIEQEKPDVIFMDMSMPVIDGMHACEVLKEYDYSKHIPIIGISAHSDPAEIQAALDAGCVEYFTKPVNMKKLKESLQKLVG